LTAVVGKLGTPPSLASLKATGILFGMQLDWLFAQGSSDTNYTEIQVASAPDTNVALLGTYAYPTNTATINGLQGNLTQYYRGRIVDKLGNVSPWTAWVKGVTSADASKVLDLLNGQITESQLYKDLGAK
ncbi:host specificity protein, partial [Klebsiella pneumoniae]|nr:host specificity protein [Klebsiella pneumoniae]